ncbi:MAG: TolB family protein, partial [Gemmatimonadales bacterium]
MRSTIFLSLTLGALALGACSEDSTTAPSADAAPELAKGGKRGSVAFAHKEADGTFQVYTMMPSGAGLKRITSGPSSNYSPRWTPDRSKLVFVSNRDGDEHIYVMSADGSNAARLTQGTCVERYPAPSPDGTKIAFERACGEVGIFSIKLDGTNLSRLSYGGTQPSWHPTGVYVSYAVLDVFGYYDIAGVTVGDLTPFPVVNCGIAVDCKAPAWSPEGRTAYWSSQNGGSIRLIGNGLPPAGIELARNIGPASETAHAPTWSPDGKKVLFTASIEGVD